jgi:ATP-dependent DNA helicase RecG
MRITEQIVKGESKTLELKEKLPKNESIAKTIIAFSNTAGGKLVIGVNDEREIVGVSGDTLFQVQDKIVSIIDDSCSPGILPEIYSVNVDNKLLLVVEVSSGPLKPYFLKTHGKSNGTFIRIGATNRVADQENITELERQKRHITYDEEISYEVDLSKLDINILFEKFKARDKELDIPKLENLKLIKKQNNKLFPTNALMIILGEYSHCTIKCARFRGNNMNVFLDSKEFSGDIFSVLDSAEKFVLNYISLRGDIKGLQRTDTYEIPIPALREALINAVVHRDYINRGRDIKVAIYDDRINILSPGSLPLNLTFEDVENGRSIARNRVVANIFKELGYIEQWGSGINRIITQCMDYGLAKPDVSEKNDFFEVQIIRPNTVGTPSESPLTPSESPLKPSESPLEPSESPLEPSESPLEPSENRRIPNYSAQEQIILDYLTKNDSIKSNVVEILLDIKESRTRELLRGMLDKGYIQKKGGSKNTHYTLPDKNK